MDALQIFVRGFHSQEAGQKLASVLSDLGFELKDCFDGSSDDLGGLIETQIMDVNQLYECTPAEIKRRLYERAEIDVFVQHRTFTVVEDSTADQGI